MKRRDITGRGGAMLLLWGIILYGLGGCSDQLLPPSPSSPQQGHEPRVYYNGMDEVVADSTKGPWDVTIYSVRPEGTGRDSITRGFISSSPQKGRIAFYSGGSLGSPGIYLADEDGSNPRLLVQQPADAEIWPSTVVLSPDGATVAYVSESGNEGWRLHVRTPTRSSSYPLGTLSMDFPSVSLLPLTPPVFSPNGEHVAAVAVPVAMRPRLLVVDVAGGRDRLFDFDLWPFPLYAPFAPQHDWSSDSRRIVFVGGNELSGADLYSVDIHSGRVDTLTRDMMVEESPRFVGSGSQIVYLGIDSVSYGDSELYLRDQMGVSRRLTYDRNGYKVGLTVSPDGRQVAYAETLNPIGDALPPIRTYDLIRRASGPVLAFTTSPYWRR